MEVKTHEFLTVRLKLKPPSSPEKDKSPVANEKDANSGRQNCCSGSPAALNPNKHLSYPLNRRLCGIQSQIQIM
jgi:hypothetical protein